MKLQQFIEENKTQVNTILDNLDIEIKDIESNAITSFRDDMKTIPTNKTHLELLTIQFLINEFELEDIQYKNNETLNQQLTQLNKYF